MGKAQREKGKRGELELAGILREEGYDTRRGQQYCGAAGNADVIGLPGIHIECKRVEKLNLLDAVAQAVHDALPLRMVGNHAAYRLDPDLQRVGGRKR